MTLDWKPTIDNCDSYLGQRTGRYEWRAVRYRAAAWACYPLQDSETVMDVGAGWTEFDYCLRTEFRWRGRYIPIDGGIDGTDLNDWTPAREVDWIVALEIIEHLREPDEFLMRCMPFAKRGIIVSTPNPETTDVLGMDPTHVCPVPMHILQALGFTVVRRSFYGQDNDSLFAMWTP